MRLVFFLVTVLSFFSCLSQEEKLAKKYTIDASPFYGSVLRHNPSISHLITNHPDGVILSFNKKTFGQEEWERAYNYPDVGYSFIYQNMNNSTLGEHYGVFLHYSLYYLKRNLQLRIGPGISYNTNPYDKETNFRNNAYGTSIMASVYFMLNYHKENIYKGLGFKAGLSLIHYSNGSFKSPNTSTNTLAFNAGFVYDLSGGKEIPYKEKVTKLKFKESVKYNVALRAGINSSDVEGMGQYPFYVVSAYADKRIGRKSAFHFGTDIFFSRFLKEYIRFQSISFPENNVSADTDYKRVGVFVGHELFINKLSVTTQLGYYVYYPFDFEGRMYNRLGLKRYLGDKVFAEFTLKSHAANAEAFEFGVGLRF
ncbi:acyloxyacyl hydrolase [uncultured Maribacter sp.]|uniref:acyloxyacyl hydrolase n=1 Tax=uncultured Maribacter sp. TaxID=431308 RepID=UPI002608C5B0|nr:acyloxyacyl hydrolase [uncultured Maribacter sp.]